MALAEKVLRVERDFERSRLEGECMACAYELLFPIQRQELIPKQREAVVVAPPWNEQRPLRAAVGA
jgi:hypothetical protein